MTQKRAKKPKPKPVLYDADAVNALRRRLHREHAAELDRVRTTYYQRGVISGRNALRQQLAALLVEEHEE